VRKNEILFSYAFLRADKIIADRPSSRLFIFSSRTLRVFLVLVVVAVEDWVAKLEMRTLESDTLNSWLKLRADLLASWKGLFASFGWE